ncbi:MAG: oxidoreductase [Pseudonocardia sp. SCN 72-86]|nr:MAG: oxidoreductase [Pseudonocardia sp. SCN 72-86]
MDPVRDVDQAGVRGVYGTFPTGIVAICALGEDDRAVGMAASSFVAVSLDPPIVSVCVQHTSTTWPVLAGRARLGLSVMSSTQEGACRRLAARGVDRFAELDLTVTAGGAVLIDGAAAWLECGVHDVVRAGDHDVVLLRIEALKQHVGVTPLVFHGSAFHTLAAMA